MTVDLVNTGASPIGVAIVPTIAPGTLSSFDQCRETPRSKFKIVSPAGTNNRVRLTHDLPTDYSLSLGLGTTSIDNLVNIRTLTTGNPANTVYWTILVQSIDTASAYSFQLDYTFVQRAEMSSRTNTYPSLKHYRVMSGDDVILGTVGLSQSTENW